MSDQATKRQSDPIHRELMLLLAEQTDDDTAENALWLAVISQAVFDAYLHTGRISLNDREYICSAHEFFDGHDFLQICTLIGLDRDWTREKIRAFAKVAGNARKGVREKVEKRLHVRRVNRRKRFIDLGQKELAL